MKPLGVRIGEVGVFWPELTTWLNPDNVSLLVMVDAVWKDIVFMRVGIDSPILGNTQREPGTYLRSESENPKAELGDGAHLPLRRVSFS